MLIKKKKLWKIEQKLFIEVHFKNWQIQVTFYLENISLLVN